MGLLKKLGGMAKDKLGDLWDWAGKKLIVLGAAYILTALKTKHPDWPLPGEQFTKDMALAFVGAHTLTDVVAILKTAGNEALAGKAQQ